MTVLTRTPLPAGRPCPASPSRRPQRCEVTPERIDPALSERAAWCGLLDDDPDASLATRLAASAASRRQGA